MEENPKIVFQAEVVKVQTMADGSPRITFGAGENAIKQAAMLMECQAKGVYLNIEITQHAEQIGIALNEERKSGLG